MNQPLPTEPLLAQIKTQFYDHKQPERRYHQDQRMLLYALTWPAQWLDHRGLPITPVAYQKLIKNRLHDIATHGQPKHYRRTFPRYLLKCIQDWFQHHGDELYEQLKHVRNQLTTIENLLKQNTQSTQDNQHAHLTRLAETHQILKYKGANKISKKDSQQLDLF